MREMAERERYEVDLAEWEANLFAYLVSSLSHPSAPPSVSGLTLRVAGGWVRDKLLDINTSDVDIALDKCTGREFAEWLAKLGSTEGKEGNMKGAASDYHVVKANPSQSKHLETATMKLFGVDVDFVNLRSETYTQGSRIPSMELGTPEEDALRRDFTINAMFYNLHTKKVEDLLGNSLQDLDGKLLRTPMNAIETFKDDPLRVMRAVRFAGRLNFDLHPDIIRACSDEGVREGLKEKVSRERVGKEFEGFFKTSSSPSLSLSWMWICGIEDLVYSPPVDSISPSWSRVKYSKVLSDELSKPQEVKLMYLAMPLANLGKQQFVETGKGGKEK